MASNSVTDVWGWIVSLPPTSQWNTDIRFLCIYGAEPSQPSLNLRVIRNLNCHNPNVIFSLTADFNTSISLWSTNPLYLKSSTDKPFDPKYLKLLLCGIIDGVLKYGSYKKPSLGIPGLQIDKYFRDIFNLAFLTLALLVCIYEAPQNLRWPSVEGLRCKLSSRSSQEAMRQLVRILGSNLEEKWMRSVNLAITNWNFENRSFHQSLSTPSALFSYSLSTTGLWKVQMYCPISPMTTADDRGSVTNDRRLLFSLNYQQLEVVIQFTYKVIFREYWIDVIVKVDNIRCDVIQLVSEKLMAKQGYGSEEKHFPSRISLQLNPTLQNDVLSVSVSKSSDNPIHEVGLEKGIEGTFEPPGPHLGLKVSASESVTMAIKPWKFEQSVFSDSAVLSWFLHDGVNGKEVSSTRPPKMALFRPRSWFRNRYSSAYRPFTRQGGVIFAGDEYGESVRWKVCKGAEGKNMEWEINGRFWLTYWPNKRRTFYTETRMLEFKELLHITLSK